MTFCGVVVAGQFDDGITLDNFETLNELLSELGITFMEISPRGN